MKKNNFNKVEISIYKCEIYSPLPDKIIDEIFIRAYNQLEAKQKAKQQTSKRNLLLINAQKINIYE